MKILYQNNINLDNFNLNLESLVKVDDSRPIYYITNTNDNKTYILKKLKNKEIQNILYLKNYIKDNIFFVQIYVIFNNKEDNFIIMEKLNIDFDYLLYSFSKKYLNLFLVQCLVSIYLLNHKFKLYHNDLYFDFRIRNIMLYQNNSTDLKNYNFYNMKISLKHFYIKIIDFEWADKTPGFRTTEYYKKYFSHIPFISEVMIFIHFYYLTINKNYLYKLNKIIKNIINENKNINLKKFDYKLIEYFYNHK